MASITKRHGKDGSLSYLIRVFLDENGEGRQHTKSKTWRPAPGMKEATPRLLLWSISIPTPSKAPRRPPAMPWKASCCPPKRGKTKKAAKHPKQVPDRLYFS